MTVGLIVQNSGTLLPHCGPPAFQRKGPGVSAHCWIPHSRCLINTWKRPQHFSDFQRLSLSLHLPIVNVQIVLKTGQCLEEEVVRALGSVLQPFLLRGSISKVSNSCQSNLRSQPEALLLSLPPVGGLSLLPASRTSLSSKHPEGKMAAACWLTSSSALPLSLQFRLLRFWLLDNHRGPSSKWFQPFYLFSVCPQREY